jgi:putative ATP-dependent endonuclease of OLD family
MPEAAVIRRLKIERFRGVKSLTWFPSAGVNVLLGGGDVGKTTILEAISLLLSPTNTVVISDADYYGRDVTAEFAIEAVLSLPVHVEINQQQRMAWPWEWKDGELKTPQFEEGAAAAQDVVYCVRVRGTPESELAYEIVQPSGETDTFSVALRRGIGLVRLGGDDRNDRDLRLVQGSALDRLLDDKGLRGRLGAMLGKEDFHEKLKDESKAVLTALDSTFKKKTLPSSLGLGLTGGPGLSLGALVGLTAEKDDVALPLASWGAGTRRLASLAIAGSLQSDYPITVVDELERGLEPYRQRRLIAELEQTSCQVFVTTHSAPVIHGSQKAALWYVDNTGAVAELKGAAVDRLRKSDPEAFLSKLTILAEGPSELGFTEVLVSRAVEGDPLAQGFWGTPGGGNEEALALLETLSKAGLLFGGFADNEGANAGRWAAVKAKLGDLLFRWDAGALEDNVIPLFKDNLPALIEDPTGAKTGYRYRTLSVRLGIESAAWDDIRAKAGDELVSVIIAAAAGRIPADMQDAGTKKAWKSHSQDWFKTRRGGRELADKVLRLGAWPKLQDKLLPFLNAVRKAAGLPAITALPN